MNISMNKLLRKLSFLTFFSAYAVHVTVMIFLDSEATKFLFGGFQPYTTLFLILFVAPVLAILSLFFKDIGLKSKEARRKQRNKSIGIVSTAILLVSVISIVSGVRQPGWDGMGLILMGYLLIIISLSLAISGFINRKK